MPSTWEKGEEVTTDFYPKQQHKIRIVSYIETNQRCQTGTMVHTTCGLGLDSAWFKKVNNKGGLW